MATSPSQSPSPLRNPLIVALDVDSADRCLELASSLAEVAGGFKLGPRLLVRHGQALIERIARLAPVFVDNKYLDIPSTMESAVRATFEAGASLATVHAWAGPEALARLATLEAELSALRPFRILAVTILTSFDAKTLPPHLSAVPIDEQVAALARIVFSSGLRGLVCSPHEATLARALASDAYVVTPGIRFPERAGEDDQKRVLGPAEAMAQGASAIVVGRPIIEATDPATAAARFLEEIRA